MCFLPFVADVGRFLSTASSGVKAGATGVGQTGVGVGVEQERESEFSSCQTE